MGVDELVTGNDPQNPNVDSLTTEAINTEQGFISGLTTTRVDGSTVSVAAGACISESDDETHIALGSSATASLTSTGAGGRQSGLAEQSSSWYAVYVIAESDGANPAILLVEESQTLALPSGYDTYRLVGYIRNNSGGGIDNYHQPTPTHWEWRKASDHTALNTASPATSATSIDLSDHVPPSADMALVKILCRGDASTGTARTEVSYGGNGHASSGQLVASGPVSHSDTSLPLRNVGYVGLNSNREIDYITNNVAEVVLRVAGWIDYR